MDKKIYNEKNGAVTKGEMAAYCFEREVAKTSRDNVHFPNEQAPVLSSRYNPYKEGMKV